MIRASKLDINLYEEVEADKGATSQALAVVVISSLASGIGTLGILGIEGLIFTTAAAIIGWLIWAYMAFIIGTKLLPEPETKSDFGEMLRTTGFSSSPGVIRILAFIPLINVIVSIVASVWMLVAMVIAVKQALDYKSTWRALGVCVIGFVIYMVILFVVVNVFEIRQPV